jgi:AraC-like DNA-binding protein
VVGIYPIETDNYLSPVQSDSHLVTITLSHEGINRLLGLPLIELVNANITLDCLYGSELGTLTDQLENMEKDMDKVQCLDHFFVRKLRRGHYADHRRIFRIMDILNSTRSMVSVQDLASEMNMHTRTLERLFVADIGLTPKELLRIRRFIKLKDYLVRDPAIHWSDLILRCGFYDQAHLNHEINKVTNMSPADFFRIARTLN